MATWVVERTQDRRFPFRITIEQGGRTLLAVRAQNHWPGAGSQIFCLREAELDPAEALEPFERVPIAHLTRLGRKLSVTLDRAQRKRCEFLKIEHAVVVVEAQYADFSNPAKIGRWPASHLLRVIGELAVLHPAVPLVFAGNRKLANVWAQRFFAGVGAALDQPLPSFVREPVARFEAEPADGGTDTRVRLAALRELPDAFEFGLLRARFTEISELRLRRILNQLRAEGRLRCTGRGRAARWVRLEAQGAPAARKSE